RSDSSPRQRTRLEALQKCGTLIARPRRRACRPRGANMATTGGKAKRKSSRSASGRSAPGRSAGGGSASASLSGAASRAAAKPRSPAPDGPSYPGERWRAPYACAPWLSRGRRFPEADSATRTPFQRDRDRIIHSSAFRRLKGKTQVFVAHEGDL